MDLSTIKPSEIELEILHPKTDEPVGVKVILISPDDDRMKSIKTRIQDNNIQKQKRNKALKAIEIQHNENVLLAETIINWDWYGKDVEFKGQKPEFNKKTVLDVLSTLPWFKQQIDDTLSDTKGFFTE